MHNPSAFVATAVVVVLLVLVVEMDALRGLFNTTGLTWWEWLACAGVSSSILIVGEVVNAVLRAPATPRTALERRRSCGLNK